MNVKKIRKNQVIKNYKSLCVVLEEPIKTGNAKIAQIKNFSRYFQFHKDKNKFIIDKIYTNPLPERCCHNKYIDKIQSILLLYLVTEVKDKHNFETVKTFTKLLQMLNLVNETYIIGYYHKYKKYLRQVMDIDKIAINDFYILSRSEFGNILKRAFVNINKRKVMNIKKIYMLIIKKTDERFGDYEDADNEIKSKYIYRKAKKDETKLIDEARKNAIQQCGYINNQHLFFASDYEYSKYNEAVENELKNENIKWRYYTAYEIKIENKSIVRNIKTIIGDNNIKDIRAAINQEAVKRITHIIRKMNTIDVDMGKLMIDKLISSYGYDNNIDIKVKNLYMQYEEKIKNKLKIKEKRIAELEQEKSNIIADDEEQNRGEKISGYEYYMFKKGRSNVRYRGIYTKKSCPPKQANK